MINLQIKKPLYVGDHDNDKWKAYYYEFNNSYISIYEYKNKQVAPFEIAINDKWQDGKFFDLDTALDRAMELIN